MNSQAKPSTARTTELVIIIGLIVLPSALASAGIAGGLASIAGGGLPWEGPMQQLLGSVTGPVAQVVGAIAIVATGLGIAFSEGGGMMRKCLWVVLGLTITFNATSWGLGFMGFGGGLLV